MMAGFALYQRSHGTDGRRLRRRRRRHAHHVKLAKMNIHGKADLTPEVKLLAPSHTLPQRPRLLSRFPRSHLFPLTFVIRRPQVSWHVIKAYSFSYTVDPLPLGRLIGRPLVRLVDQLVSSVPGSLGFDWVGFGSGKAGWHAHTQCIDGIRRFRPPNPG